MDMEETKRKELDFEYKDWDGQKCMKVWMEIEGCKDTGNISVAFYSEENGGMDPVIRVTEDFGIPLEKNQAFLHESMTAGPGLMFLQKYGMGEFTGKVGRSGIRECPVFEFHEEVLKDLDAGGYRQYEEIRRQEKREPAQDLPDTIKTAAYHWELGDEEIALLVESYLHGDGICVQMYNRQEDGWGLFQDLTVNLSGYFLEPGEAFIDANLDKDNLKFIKEQGLGKVLPGKVRSGMQKYRLVEFSLEKLAQFDEMGVRKYCKSQEIELDFGKKPALQETKGSRGNRKR